MNWKAIRGAALLPLLFVAVCVLGAQAFASGVCPGGPVTVTLYSPASGTHPTPVMVSATATSTGGAISGYVVYTDVPTAGTNAYQINATSLNAWVILPLLQNGGAQTQHVYVRAWDGTATATIFPRSRSQLPEPTCPRHLEVQSSSTMATTTPVVMAELLRVGDIVATAPAAFHRIRLHLPLARARISTAEVFSLP